MFALFRGMFVKSPKLYARCESSLGCNHYGIPQGSLLWPRLYSIFVNDLPDWVGDIGNVYLYADDTALSFIGESVHEVFAALNVIMDNVLQWSKNNQLTMHLIKTEAMLLNQEISFYWSIASFAFWIWHNTCSWVWVNNLPGC